MANNTAADLPPEAIAFATRMYDAARAGQIDIFQQALPAGLPANMTNEKGDSLVGDGILFLVSFRHFALPTSSVIMWKWFWEEG
jgi:hypothetical protein